MTRNTNITLSPNRKRRLMTAAEVLEISVSEMMRAFIDEKFGEWLQDRGVAESTAGMTLMR
jgi:hypothetical protein